MKMMGFQVESDLGTYTSSLVAPGVLYGMPIEDIKCHIDATYLGAR